MIEPEIAFADLADDMDLAEAMVKSVIAYVLEQCPAELAFFNQFFDKGLLERLNALVNSEFVRVSYTEAVELLKAHNDQFQYKVDWGTDLQTEHERYLTEQIYKKPVFVTDYPKEITSFYMRLNDGGKTVAAADTVSYTHLDVYKRQPPAMTGRVMAFTAAAVQAAQPAGQLLYGVLFDTLPGFWVLSGTGAARAVLGALFAPLFRRPWN